MQASIGPSNPPLCRIAILLSLFALLSGCRPAQSGSPRVVIDYWEKWSGFEADAMRAVVDDYNASQNRVFVRFTSTSQIDRRLMLATAGGVPPDVAGVYNRMLPVYADNNALTPLDRMAAQAGVTRDRYIDVFWRMCMYRGHLWALPSTPTSTALIWNKALFRKAGLDPDRPPASIAELEQFNQKLAIRRPDGGLESIGFMPGDPPWWDSVWGYWFGASLWDGASRITADSPENIAAYRWIESYPQRFGAHNLAAFRDGFGAFASPANPFLCGRVAMVMQGVWIYEFIKKYAPAGFEWGAAPFPSADPARLPNVTLVESDELVIPHGARHPREAFDFIRYVNSQGPMEKLCLAQLKFPPLRDCSPEFLKNHPNPYISTFIALAKSPNAHARPQLSTWTEYDDDMTMAMNRVCAGDASAEQALKEVQDRQQQVLDRKLARWRQIAPELMSAWSRQ